MKVAMTGAGSMVCAKTLLNDMLATPALQGPECALMSRTEPKLRPTPKIERRRNVKRAEMPFDPALAIGKRFMTLTVEDRLKR